jgi:hypothetical protein
MLQYSSLTLLLSPFFFASLHGDLSNQDKEFCTEFDLLCVSFGDQALQHACIACSRKLVLEWVAATDLEDRAKTEVLLLSIVLEGSCLLIKKDIWSRVLDYFKKARSTVNVEFTMRNLWA